MIIEIINTGSELMLGSVLNTHQQWLCRQLSNLGYVVDRQTAVPDTGEAIQQAVREALGRADFIIATGGLGPTSDDLTRQLIADLLGRKLHQDSAVLARLEEFFSLRQRRMPESTKVQALVPEGGTVLHNQNGTAPGLVLEVDPGRFRESDRSTLLVMLPGPPRELRPMFVNQVVPILKKEFPLETPFVSRVFRTTGLGESLVEEKIAGPLAPLISRGLELGYCARLGEVDVRLAARSDGADALLREGEEIVRSRIGRHIFGLNEEELEGVVIRLLTGRRETLATAESCTGGFISHCLTNVPGSSAVLLGGVVTYSNDSKQLFLNVRADTLSTHGAVSEATAREMAEGIRLRLGSTYGLSVTGIAGPAGGTPEKPVGTVHVGLASGQQQTVVQRFLNPYDRASFKYVTSRQALDLLRRTVLASWS